MRKQIAKLTTAILNPILIGVAAVLIVSLETVANVLDAFKWTLIALAISILPLLLAIICLIRIKRIDSIFTSVRSQRTLIYMSVVLLAGIGIIILQFLAAPLELLSLFIAGLLSGIIFMCINLWCKISLHTATIAGLVTVAYILYGSIAGAGVVLIGLVVWARTTLEYHSYTQGIIGALLASSIVTLVFCLLGLI